MRQPNVLLVNPFRDESEMYAEYFAACGWSVSIYDDPESALTSVRTAAPDAIVTRIRQLRDHMDGIALTATIKSDRSTSDIAVIVISTSMLAAHQDAALAAGCDAYMILPRTPNELVDEIRTVLRTKSRARVNLRPGRSGE
jgi:CheY-like chemotaxis protein